MEKNTLGSFFSSGQSGSAEIQVPLGLGENIFSFLVKLWGRPQTWWGAHRDGDPRDLHRRQASRAAVAPGRSARIHAGPGSPEWKGPVRRGVWREHRAGNRAWAVLWFTLPLRVAYWA